MTPQEEYLALYQRMADICAQQEWGDPFSYARSKEIYAAIKLGHTVSETLSGADAYREDGAPLEYKSTIGPKCQGSYTGISVQPSWQEQVKYLTNEKIGKYPEHFYNRFDGGKLVESWKMSGDKVLKILLAKLEKSFSKVKTLKDPRLAATITWSEIQDQGEKVL